MPLAPLYFLSEIKREVWPGQGEAPTYEFGLKEIIDLQKTLTSRHYTLTSNNVKGFAPETID